MLPRHALLRAACFLLLITLLPSTTAQTCVSHTAYTPAHAQLALSQTSRFAMAMLGRERNGVRIYNITTEALVTRTPIGVVARPEVCTVQVMNGAAYTPFFARAIAIHANLAAISSPNRDRTASPAYSMIDLFNPQHIADGTPYASAVSTIFDLNTNTLGLIVAFDTQKTFLASYYDETTIVVYSPLIGRAMPTFDPSVIGVSQDFKIGLPTGFKIDSFTVNNGVLLVSGITNDATSGNCVPRLLSYAWSSATGTAARTWTLSASVDLLRDAAAGVSADVNAVPCFIEPSAALPLELSQDGVKLVVGVPSQSCVYAVDVVFTAGSAHRLTQHVRCADINLVGEDFGRSVSFTSKADGASFLVASDATVTQYSYADWIDPNVNPLDTSFARFYQFPNRLQAGTSSRRIAALGSRDSVSLVLYAPVGSSPVSGDLLYLRSSNVIPAGSEWSPSLNTISPCSPGRSSSGTSTSFQGCTFCAPGTYQPAAGQSACLVCTNQQYCPAGAVTNGYLTESFSKATAFTSVLPWFEYDGYREVFEELLVSNIFSVSMWPSMIIFFILICLCVVVYISSYWADADGDEKDCCSNSGNCCLHTYRLLGRFKYFTLGKDGPWPYTKRPKEVVPDVIQYDADGAAIHTQGVVDTTGKPSNMTSVRNADGSVTTTTYDPASTQDENVHSPECEGFMALVFLLFALSAVSYTGMYLASYDPTSPEDTAQQNVYRTRVEYARANNLEAEWAQSIDALFGNAFELHVGLLGTSATCSSSLVQTFVWPGCTYPNPSTNGQPLPCSNLLMTAASISATPDACDLLLKFPVGTTFPSTSRFAFTFASASTFAALRLGLSQNATNIALSLPASGTTGSSANDANTATIAGYTFSETLFVRDASSTSNEQIIVSPVTRTWRVTPVAYRSQRESSWTDVFDTVWYAQTTDLDSPILQTETPASYLYASVDSITVDVNLVLSNSFTVNQTQRLIGRQGVLITMVMSVVAIWVLVLFVEALFKIAYGMCCQKVHRGIVSVAQSTGATGPATQLPLDAKRANQLTIPPRRFPDVISYPPPPQHQQQMPVYGGGFENEGWSHFEPAYNPAPYPGPNYYDGSARSRAVTPRHYAGGMPMTPGHLPPIAGTFAEDRARYAARQQRAAQTPTTRHGFENEIADDRIDVEMSTRHPPPQRGGFEL